MNDVQRDQIDADAKTVLRDIHAAVNVLSEAEKVRQQGEAAIAEKRRRKNDLGALGKWAAGGLFGESDVQPSAADVQGNGIKAHREGVIWYLQTRLDQCGRMQSSMMRIRLDREVEKSKSVLYKARGSGPVPVWDDDMLGGAQLGAVGMSGKRSKHGGMSVQGMEQRSTGQEQPSEEQMQLFAKENQDLLKQYENKMDQVRYASYAFLSSTQS
jgi:syntaxin 18